MIMVSSTFIWTVVAITTGSSFQFGYQTGVINAPLQFIESFIHNVSSHRSPRHVLNADVIRILSSLVVAVFPAGGVIGALASGLLADKFGRKGSLMLLSLPTILGSVLMAVSQLAQSFEVIIIGRFIIGLSCGAYSGIAPMYLSEIAPLSIRGVAGSLNQLVVVIAILLSQILGLEFVLGNSAYWPYLLGFTLIPAFLQLLLLPFCPDSPRYFMITKKDELAARRALSRLRSGDFEDEIQLMQKDMRESGSRRHLSVLDIFRTPHLRLAVFIAIGMQLSQQFSGINTIINYSSKIFKASGLDESSSIYATIGIGLVNLVVTAISVSIVEKFGRRGLHLVGLWGMLCSLVVLTGGLLLKKSIHDMIFVVIAAIYVFVAFFAVGPGAIPWFITAEIFSQEARGSAIAVAGSINWISQIVIGMGYLQLLKYMKNYSFLPFVACLVVFIIFTHCLVPETKARSSEEMEREFRLRTHTLYVPVDSSFSASHQSGPINSERAPLLYTDEGTSDE